MIEIIRGLAVVFAEDIPDTPASDPTPGKLCDHIIRIVSNGITPQPLGSIFVPSMINSPQTNNKIITRRSAIVSEAVETFYNMLCAFVLFYVARYSVSFLRRPLIFKLERPFC